MRKRIILLCFFLCLICLVGCSPMSQEEKETENIAQAALVEAQKLYESEDYEGAVEIAKSIVDDYPETSAAKNAQEILEEYASNLLEQEQQAYEEKNWSMVISLNSKIISAVPHTDIANESQTMANEARSVINKHSEEKAPERAKQKEQLMAEREQEQQKMFSQFRSEHDQVLQVTWYYPSSAPKYINTNSCFIYMGKDDGDYPYYRLRWIMSYAGNDWIFFDNIIINIDGTNYYKTFDYFEVNRDNNYGGVWEYVDIFVTSEDIEILNAIANSEQTIIRFQGDTYYYDKTVTQTEKDGIQSILNVYNAVKN